MTSSMVSLTHLTVAALCVVAVRGRYQYPSYCAAPNTINVLPSLGGITPPPLPVLPDTFQVRVEATIIDGNRTMVAEEYYDMPNNRAAVRIFKNNTQTYMIFDYTNDQIIYDTDGNCYTTELKHDFNNMLYGMKSSAGMPHVYTTSGTLQLAKANGLGKQWLGLRVDYRKVDGWFIFTTHFHTYKGSNLTKGHKSVMLLNKSMPFYDLMIDRRVLASAAYRWTEPDQFHQVPLRAEVTGLQLGVSASRSFHHIYEYIDFRHSLWGDETLFEIPRGTVCQGRKQTRPVPVLTGQYSYREEIVSNIDNSVSYADVWNDYANKLVRFDYRFPYAADPFYTTNPVTKVLDYSTGIAYAMDRALGNCTIMPIENGTFYTSLNITTTPAGNQYFIHMKSPGREFYLDNTTYTYEGTRTTRGILCDVFVSNRTDFLLPGYDGPLTSVIEVYFLNKKWMETNNIGFNSPSTNDIPVAMTITTPPYVGFEATYNFYDWDAEDPSYNRFDVTSCYSATQKQQVSITFPGQFDVPSFTPYKMALLNATVKQITAVTHLSNIRVQSAEFHIASSGCYFIATLLDLPPTLALFRPLIGYCLTRTDGRQFSGCVVDACATECNKPSSLCNAFDFYASICTCVLYSTRAGTLFATNESVHYSRSVSSRPLETTLSDSLRDLTSAVMTGNFNISIQMNGTAVNFTAQTIHESNAKRTGIIPQSGPFTYPSYCAAPNTTDVLPSLGNTTAPPLPSLPDTFQVRVEANIIDKNLTVVAEEYYDQINNRAAVRLFQNNSRNYMIFDYSNDQIIYDVDGNCYATDLEYDSNNLLFGMKVPHGIPHIYTTSGALHFAKANGLTYMGTTTVRGIPADHWQSCLDWAALQANFTLDYYFSAYTYNWAESDQSPQVPLRAEVRGFKTLLGNWSFHHMYEYYDFRHSIWGDDTLFETPRGTICKGRKQIRPVPVLTGQYSYREEIVSTGDQSVSQADVWYDYTYKLVRFDYRPPSATYPYYATNPVTEVHDYSTGIAYAIDRALGNCTIMPIQNTTFDSSLNITTTPAGQQFYIRMKSPDQLFYLDNLTYTYEGPRTVRGMLCDVFVSQRKDFSIPGYQPFTSVFEFYFLNKKWMETNNVGIHSRTNSDIPVQLIITTPDWVGYQATYNIYNWDAEDPSYKRFDVTSCYSVTQKQPVSITFPGQFDPVQLTPYKLQLLTATVNQVTAVTHMSNIRVQNAEFHIGSTSCYFVATLLDLPPPKAFFKQQLDYYMTGLQGKQITGRGLTVDSCATSCNNQSSPCNAFDFCPSTGICTLYSSRAGTLAASSTCNHYSRAASSLPFEMPLSTSWKDLKNEVLSGNFIVTIQMNGKSQSYTAQTVDGSIIQNANRQLQTQTLMNQFSMQVNKGLNGYDDYIATGVAIDDCANQCINKQSWICNSFSYCFNTGYCVQSKLHPDARPKAVVNMNLCDLYTRQYTAGFELFPGTTVLSSSTNIYQNIYTADECAKLCTFYTGFNCKSFDYCSDISTCYLGKVHYYDVPQTDRGDTPMCNHYSRNYIADFQQSKRMQLQNTADRIISNVNLTQCAKQCVEEESINCASFGYCANMRDCRLSTGSMRNVGQVSYTPSMTCDIYNRVTFPDGTPYINNPEKYYHIKTGNTGYSGGSMAGIGFGLFIAGIITAIGGFFVITKVRRKPKDEMAMSFVKAQEENE